MPIYAYQCTNDECEKEFELHLPFAEYDKTQVCPVCETSADKQITPVGFVLKGDSWPGKNLRIKSQMAAKNQRLAGKENEKKRDAPPVQLAPNVEGERVASWSDAKKLAGSKGKDTSSYDSLIRKEKRGDA